MGYDSTFPISSIVFDVLTKGLKNCEFGLAAVCLHLFREILIHLYICVNYGEFK